MAELRIGLVGAGWMGKVHSMSYRTAQSAFGPEPAVPGVVDGLEQLGLRGDLSYGAQDTSNPRPLARVLAEHEALAAVDRLLAGT